MIRIPKFINLCKYRPIQYFASDKFMKQRDQASERVYISRQEKQAMKKLLQKLSEQKKQDLSKQGQFQRRLEEILKRYKVSNSSFTAEVINLHNSLP